QSKLLERGCSFGGAPCPCDRQCSRLASENGSAAAHGFSRGVGAGGLVSHRKEPRAGLPFAALRLGLGPFGDGAVGSQISGRGPYLFCPGRATRSKRATLALLSRNDPGLDG